MEAANLHKPSGAATSASAGELVLQNSRQAGTRRPLGVPTTFIGRGEGCDIRLNVNGVDALHCVLVHGPDGLHLRDLNSEQGTWLNGERIENSLLKSGDVVKVGPFQFRVELSAPTNVGSANHEPPTDELRESLRIQAAAIAAQQIALEEEEARLEKRRHDLHHQESQLAAHLAEKQRQVQVWGEYTKAEREALRKEKNEHEKHRASFERETLEARQELDRERQKIAQDRQRIDQVYQRLRVRWRKQWAAEKEKYQKVARRIQSEANTYHDERELLRVQEQALEQEFLRFNTERELSTRQLQDGRTALKRDQEAWRRRRSLEMMALKTRSREIADAELKAQQARQVVQQEKAAWERQVETFRTELHGLNNRIAHQRKRIEEQQEAIARNEAWLRTGLPVVSEATQTESMDQHEEAPIESAVEVLDDSPATTENPAPVEVDWTSQRVEELERLATELADQRVHLLEQYARLAEVQQAWQDQREQAAAELEGLAQHLHGVETKLAERRRQADATDHFLVQRQRDLEEMRQELMIARAQMKTHAEGFEKDYQAKFAALARKETVLLEQFAELTNIRQRWNRSRQQEVQDLRASRAQLLQVRKEAQAERLKWFEKSQDLDVEKRGLAEKSLMVEQYRQEIFFRAKDPSAQRRVERLRRRWLTLNASLIRAAKEEREYVRKELAKLDPARAELVEGLGQLTEGESRLTEERAQLDQRHAELRARTNQLEERIADLEMIQRQADHQRLRMQDEVDTLAKAVYDAAEDQPVDRAA
ncbi:MAG: FHA domain-containing protein [Planctomycetes bacterium]|nr:FHA domain-containing protein [Planctomycetota bacterium]